MPRLFVANLHFELQIASDRQTLPINLEQRTAELAASWLAVANTGDSIWCPQPVADSFWRDMAGRGLPLVHGLSDPAAVPPGLELVPWGWSATIERFARSIRATCDAPPASAVATANSRRFALALEQQWDVGLERTAPITSLAELDHALCTIGPYERWVLKAEYGAAARQRIICTGRTHDPTSAGWIRKRLAAGEWLIFEPWVERIAEVGVQWTIPHSGPPVLEGVTELLTDADGQYRGSIFGLDTAALEHWAAAVEVTRQAATQIQQHGYFGPLGIDAMCYRDAAGHARMRPLQDINARWTMGRLALGWRRIMPSGVWRHGTPSAFAERRHADPRVVRTSPEAVGNRPARIVTWLEPCEPATHA